MNQEFQQSIFKHLNKKANISPHEIIQVAQSVQNADFSDERTVRKLVRQLAQMANKPMDQSKEDRIVEMITKNNKSIDQNTLQQIFKK
ncbi:stage VI sporulation protein F [Halalkalibacillus sediminis]|uniref:Stage VI sporulation protein F n=1 Tax=Halalkalibacillus sediminis TaxID=2018042 RepID=A0A2I0QX27_9BACI|nr:stage VI sporulation protein F [Halalkalibacillus sediminis]PKR78858.1 stage VI sporulation protein F [Halalkalibacillus sediminis]